MNEKQDPAEVAFGIRLRDQRKVIGMSQETLAEQMRKLGYDAWRQQTITKVESGRRSVRLGEALALASLTGTALPDVPAPWVVRPALAALANAQAAIGAASAQLHTLIAAEAGP